MSVKPKHVAMLSDLSDVRHVSSLYEKFDAYPLEAPAELEYSNTGLSILDDVSFFLKDPKLRGEFESAFLIHLKNFSIERLQECDLAHLLGRRQTVF